MIAQMLWLGLNEIDINWTASNCHHSVETIVFAANWLRVARGRAPANYRNRRTSETNGNVRTNNKANETLNLVPDRWAGISHGVTALNRSAVARVVDTTTRRLTPGSVMCGCPTTDRREKRETSSKTFGIGEGRGRGTDCSGDSGNESKDSGELHGE